MGIQHSPLLLLMAVVVAVLEMLERIRMVKPEVLVAVVEEEIHYPQREELEIHLVLLQAKETLAGITLLQEIMVLALVAELVLLVEMERHPLVELEVMAQHLLFQVLL